MSAQLSSRSAGLTPGCALSNCINAQQADPQAPAQLMTFQPTATWVQEGVGLEWLGRLYVSGIFDGRHRFDLQAQGEGEEQWTLLTQSEVFSGLAIWLGRATGAAW